MQVEVRKTQTIEVTHDICQHKCCEGASMTLGIPPRAQLAFYRDGTFVLTLPGLEYLALTITRQNAIEVMKCIKPVTRVRVWRMEA